MRFFNHEVVVNFPPEKNKNVRRRRRNPLDPGDFFTALIIALLVGIIIIGPLATGIGFIFTTFLKAIGIGIVSFVLSVITITAFLCWCME